ncbi:universal stress protein [Leifsonia sp. 21MFCrub1.1]|uniref:universal stress protein n=1 Tax=Leifsonia sp. 21MFCrub1.1 TaxID=1798223 RepID=UPI0008929C6B|nr:universal stress protein [Leifsonia sp. 21MFCrub1.1]SEA50896.1 Nucleotide-binding universal stress protein, UspA family [Leifsonia sp. 21MFCrub1.1]
MSTNTIVGWDGSLEADVALEWAVRRAEELDDGIILVDVEDAGLPVPGQVITPQMVAARHEAADRQAQRLSDEHPGLRVNTHIMAGDRVDELRSFSRPDNLVVVGTGVRRGPRSRYHWSLGARLATTARGAVAIIPALPDEARSRVVVGIDGSEVSLKAARYAAREARRLGHELVVAHGWLDPLIAVSDMRMEGPLLGELEEEHRRMLDSVVDSLRSANPDLTISSSLVRDQVYYALAEPARSASLLVLGTQQARGVDRFLLGSVSHTMILHIETPTIVVAPECLI